MYLVAAEGGGPVLIADLARDEKIPKKFLERILLEMKTRGFLRSQKGKGGGYTLAKRPDKIFVGEVIRLMDGPIAPVSCVSQMAYAPCSECHDEATCSIRLVMKDVRDAIAGIVDQTSLADLIQRGKDATSARSENFAYDI